MSNQQHPITPPPELVQAWTDNAHLSQPDMGAICRDVATQAARWSADLELEAGLDYMQNKGFHGLAQELRDARRPKPPSLAEQALAALNEIEEQSAFRLVSGLAMEMKSKRQLICRSGVLTEKDTQLLGEAFDRWWFNEGSGMPPLPGQDHEEHAKSIARIAWHNGAYVKLYHTPPPTEP